MRETSAPPAPSSPVPPSDRVARVVFVAAVLFLVFVYGFLTAHLRWPPAEFLATAVEQGRRWMTSRSGQEHHWRPARHSLAGAARYDPAGAAVAPDAAGEAGVTMLTGFWPDRGWQPALRLIDGTGRVLHQWPASPTAIWRVSPYHDAMAKTLDPATSYVHGSHLFANGDVLFSIEYVGLVRMNAKGDVLWRLDRRTHHSVTQADDGSFWVCATVWRSRLEDVYPRLAGIAPPIMEDCVLQVSPDGQVLRELSVFDMLFRSDLRDQIWRRGRSGTDLVHLNDVEALPRSLADQYPLFTAGDLLVSLRDLDLVMVVDPASGRVKWWADRPFMRQHDPDFIGGGWISVYDNHPDGAPMGQFLGGSRIVKLRPHTGEVAVVYCPGCTRRVGEDRPFYSDLGGKAQLLAHDHWLLSEPMAGRVFEIDERGHTVWEWVQARSEDGASVSEIMEGTRYPYTPDQVAAWGAN